MRLILTLLLIAPAIVVPAAAAQSTVAPDNSQIYILGRYQTLPSHNIRLAYPGTGLAFRFTGPALSLTLTSSSPNNALSVVLDHGEPTLVLLKQGTQTVPIAKDLPLGPHTIEIYKRSETWQGTLDLAIIQLFPTEKFLPPVPLPTRKLLFIGDSVTCATAVDDTPDCKADPLHPDHDPYHSFGMVLGRRLDAQSDLVCYGGRGLQRTYDNKTFDKDGTLNAPQFIDLAIPSEDPKLVAAWDSQAFIPNAIVVSLGTNDFSLQPTQPLNPSAWIADYVKLLHHLRAEYPLAIIFATEGAIVTDPLLRQYVQQAVADSHDPNIQWVKANHYPGSSCNGHPTGPQHQKMADDLELQLRPALHW